MQRQIIVSLILIVGLLAVGTGLSVLLVRTAPRPTTSGNQQPTLLVRALEMRPQTVVEPIVGYGTARADRYAWIATQVAGEVVELNPNLHVGALVDAGELLVHVDDREYQRHLERARSLFAADQAQLKRLDIEDKNLDRLIEIAATESEIAQREYERVLGLFEAGQAPRRELDVARQSYEGARRTLQLLENDKAILPQRRAAQLADRDLHQADIGLAELNVERCRIGAPFRGRLEAVEAEIGQRVNIGTRLFALLDPDLIEVPIELPVSLRDRVSSGADCRLILESNGDVVWQGQVARIAPRAEQATRTFSLFVEVDNTQQEPPLMPGLFVRAQIDGPTWREVMVVPRGIIQQGHVFICDNGLAHRRAVGIQRHLLDQTVVSGLSAGELVITSNLDAIFDGAPVRIQQDDAVAPSAAPSASAGSAGQRDDSSGLIEGRPGPTSAASDFGSNP